MKCLVPVKRVVDPYVNVRVKADNSGVELHNVKMAMNPFDAIALEEAVRLKESGVISEVAIISIGTAEAQETLRQGLALGADRATLMKTDEILQPLSIAKVLKEHVESYGPELVIMGKQSIDGDNNQTGQMLSALLGWAQGTFVSSVSVDGSMVNVSREVDSGIERLSLKLPAVITTDLRLNEPRYASLPNVMKAKSKPLDIMELSCTDASKVTQVAVHAPAQRNSGEIVDDVTTLVDKLKNEAKVIE